MINFKVISTGSCGNAVIINDYMLIDCGVTFKALQPYYDKLQVVLLTHIHSDHFKHVTIKRLGFEKPLIRWVCREWLISDLLSCGIDISKIDISCDNVCNNYGKFIIESFKVTHNVPNCGYKIRFIESDKKLFYATDLNTLQGITAKNFDLYMIEINYKEDEIKERIMQKQAEGLYCYEWNVLKNHLSEEKAIEWLYQNMHNDSQYVYLHGHI